ncbi:MAG: SAM-dependent methyltransferase [Streptococcaceae bacterium]|nr:SAM-dependent methyltransferase [Streptococcaceae bacterium]
MENEFETLNKTIGLNFKSRQHKQQQMFDYYITVKSIVKKLSTKRTLYFYDGGCGRAYLSFYLNYLLKKDGITNVEFICIDMNKALIERNKLIALKLGMGNMSFVHSSIIDADFSKKPDVVYSLNACDSATDQLLYQALANEARFILSVSCCQHKARKAYKNQSMSLISRHKPYKEGLVDMLSNSLRTLLMEAHGYNVSVFEFTSTSATPKNVMLKCEKVAKINEKYQEIVDEYEKLVTAFNIRPLLFDYLKGEEKDVRKVS